MLNPPISPAESQPESQPDGRSLLIQNAQILQPNGEFLRGEVWVKAGIIHQVGPPSGSSAGGDTIDRCHRAAAVAGNDRPAGAFSGTGART